jgi:eukaryotic-like serine/threonine-protein kinase
MNLCGLTDSLATLGASPNECPHCHTASRIAHGLCLACLLRSGEAEADNSNRQDDFDAALDAVVVADTHWRLGNYEILEEIGRGGMGVIYRARQRHSRRIVALKRILSYHADSRETLARFRREAEAAASLDHPNILPIYEVGDSEEGVPYFSMKYASGGSLQEVGPALRNDPREVVRLLAKVTRAVQYAHRQGILHRDLKPGNILLDGRGEPMVSDFGLAKWLDTTSDLTRTLTIFGTPGYIAPEQAEGPAASLRPSSDIYSLGAILFDLLTGRPPFLGEHALAVIRQASEKPAPKLRSLVHGADRDLETICSRCLEREPVARYRSAGDLAEDLERWLEGRPIVARPVSPPVKLWRWSKRNPLLAGSLAATIIICALAIVRQVETRGLARTVRESQLAAHSIAILPFLDLETAQTDAAFANSFASALRGEMAS